jgi:signal transduction histidine kinase
MALSAAGRLFDLDAEDVGQLLLKVEDDFLAECSNWGLAQHKPLVLPLSEDERRYFDKEVKEELQQLQRQMLGETALAALDGLETAGSENLKSVLARALQQAGVDPSFIVLSARQGTRTLTVSASSKVTGLSPDLALQLQPGRSALADLILANELAPLSRNSERLAVIDRQVIDLLGGSSLLCESVQTPFGRCALLLSGSSMYPQRNLLRNFIKRKLAAFLQQEQTPKDDAPPMELTQYQQRVREAVHEANNPLAIIKNYLQILNMKLGENGASKEIRLINQEIDRVAVLLAELRRVETSEPAEAAELDLNGLVRSLHRVFLQGFNTDKPIAIELDLTDDPALVLARTDALKQILTNLVKNAVEAFDKGGSIVIATRRNVVLHEHLYMQLSVADNGPGMTAALLQNLYVPGITTKGGDHTGSGLAIVKRLVDDMQGQISCQSDSKGTVISILLPQILV